MTRRFRRGRNLKDGIIEIISEWLPGEITVVAPMAIAIGTIMMSITPWAIILILVGTILLIADKVGPFLAILRNLRRIF